MVIFLGKFDIFCFFLYFKPVFLLQTKEHVTLLCAPLVNICAELNIAAYSQTANDIRITPDVLRFWFVLA